MPQIPGLPVVEPVELPKAKPGLFAGPGETVAELGQAAEQMAQANEAFAGHLIEAQHYLKAKQAEIAFDRVLNQVHVDLSKATTPEEAQAVYEHSKGQLDAVIQPFETDRALARQLGLFRQQQDVELQNVVNARKAGLIQKGDDAANETLYEKSKKDAISSVIAGGDSSVAEAQLKGKLDASVHVMGTLTPQQEDAILQKFRKDVQGGVLDARINDPNPLVRKQTIDQLKDGKGSLDLSALDKGELNKYLTHAEHVDKSLTELAEVQNLNADIANTTEVFKSAPYVDANGTPNFDNIMSSLKDGKFLIEHGIYTTDPNTGKPIPDYVRGAKIESYYKGSEADYFLAAKQKADQYRDEIYDQFAQGHIAAGLNMARQHAADFQKAKVDYFPQIVGSAKGWQYEQMAEWRFGKAEERAARDDKIRAAEEKGFGTQDQLLQRITNGEELDFHRDIESQVHAGNMTNKQGHEIWYDYNQTLRSPDYQNGLYIINSSALPVEDKVKVANEFRRTYRQGGLTGDKAADKAKELVEGGNKKATDGMMKHLMYSLTGGTYGTPWPASTPAPATPPPRPKGVPDNAVWNPATKTWQLPQQ